MKEKYDGMLERLLLLLPDFITGNTAAMRTKYQKRYGNRALEPIIRKQKKELLTLYLAICVIFFLAVLPAGIKSMGTDLPLSDIQRPAYGEESTLLNVKAKVRYKEREIERAVTLKARPKTPGEAEHRAMLKEMTGRLEGMIVGKNQDLMHITDSLNLIELDSATGIILTWSSSNPEVLGADGTLDFIKAKPGEEINIEALLRLGESETSWETQVRISPRLSADQYGETLLRRLSEEVAALNKSTSQDVLSLPSELEDGVTVQWRKAEAFNLGLIILFFLFSLAMVYMTRYSQIDKELKAARESVYRDLPDFIHKLVLLLNAGVVMNTALLKIAADYERQQQDEHSPGQEGGRRYFYEELREIKKRVYETKTPILYELKEFAQRTGIRELIRIVAIISDNEHKGNTLAEKLETEGELLWISRKKQAEEKGKLAETKLTFPLMLLLIILVTITIAPAMMEM